MEMRSIRSGGGVLKKKSSSGCLIIKKKDNWNARGGSGGLILQRQEKKSPRLVESDSSGSDGDDSPLMSRKVNDQRLHNCSMGFKRSGTENKDLQVINAGMDFNRERKRNRLSGIDFDEYDGSDRKRMRNQFVDGRLNRAGVRGGVNPSEFGIGSSHRSLMLDKRRQSSYFDSSSSGRSKGVGYSGPWSKGFEFKEEEADMPSSSLRLKYQEKADEPIRLQGKNGVLKVMVNKKKRMDLHPHLKYVAAVEVKEKASSRSEDLLKKKNLSGRLPFYPASPSPATHGLLVDKDKSIENKKELKYGKPKHALYKSIKARESETDGMSTSSKAGESETDAADTALKLGPPGLLACSSKKGLKMEEERTHPLENVPPAKKEVKEGKIKRGGSTEKQMLREKIRGMLIEAGWTIDYRPRRNRDYLDAVYINPNGTAYWSIIKAYDAFKKQLEEDSIKIKSNIVPPSFAPLSEDLINKLTRQTKKKIEEEMRRKRKEDGMAKSVKRIPLRDAAGSSGSDQNEEKVNRPVNQDYKLEKGKQKKVYHDADDDSTDDSRRKFKKVAVEKTFIASHSNVLQGRSSEVIGRCTLMVRGSDRGWNSDSDGYAPYTGKRTVLAWLVDSGIVHLSEKVQYMNRKRSRIMLEGWITRDGIHCGCCSKILTVSKFELHAGSKLRQPFQNIFLESGTSLLHCQLDAWNKQVESGNFHNIGVGSDDPDDDTCGVCGDGGALVCCDSCPSTFHQLCLEIKMLPSGDWHCPSCTCKFCGDAAKGNSVADDELITCSFCEEKYHKSCNDSMYTPPLGSSQASFCRLKCREMYDRLQKILGVKHELEAGFSWSLIQRTDVSNASCRGLTQMVECNSKLAVALSIMDECFLPTVDRRSGVNIFRNVVYSVGSNFNRLNYQGFFTAILERSDEIVSATCIRIHGTRLAEMPFIGTREIYRRQGLCHRLLAAVEAELRNLKVEHLIIPAIPKHTNLWTRVFGFHQLEDELKKEIIFMNMLVFPGTDMLQKELLKQGISDVMKGFVPVKNQPQMRIVADNSDVDSSVKLDRQTGNNSGTCHVTKTDNKVNSLSCSSPASAVQSSDSSASHSSDSTSESDTLLVGVTSHAISEMGNKQNEITPRLKDGTGSPENEDTSASVGAGIDDVKVSEDAEAPTVPSGTETNYEHKKPSPVSTLPEGGATANPNDANRTESNELDVEHEIPFGVSGELASPVSSLETNQSVAATDNHTEASKFSGS